MRHLLTVTFFVFSSSALAQGSTTCVTIGNVTNCQPQPVPGVPDYGAILRDAQASVPSYSENRLKRAQAEALDTTTRTERERLACRRKAMKAIDAGEYDRAKALAALCP